MKKILLSLALISATISAAGGATYAYFSSTKVLGANTMTTGKLIVDVNGTDSTMALGDTSRLAPGDSMNPVSLLIKNTGDLNFGWLGYFSFTGDNLEDVIYIKEAKMEFLDDNGGNNWEPSDQFITEGKGSGPYPGVYNTLASADPSGVITLKTWNSNSNSNAMGGGLGVQMGALKPGYSYRLSFTLAMVPGASNTYQDKDMNLSYVVKATQLQSAALSSLDLADTRISIGDANAINTWMGQQITKQN